MDRRPVLYLDLDDTLVSWADGHPAGAAGAGEFVTWALSRFEVRWLTTWCPGGEMENGLLTDLATMLKVPEAHLARIRGFPWDGTDSKLNGIAWLEHLVQGRPFVWMEDDKGFTDAERRFLEEADLFEAYVHCNVTSDPDSLARAHHGLRRWFDSLAEAA